MAQLKLIKMATACETFYDQDYLDLNPDVAKAGMAPRTHWNNHGRNELTNGVFNRKWNKQCTTPQTKAPLEFKTGSSSPVIEQPTKKTIAKVVVTFSDGSTDIVE